MALSNLYDWNEKLSVSSACGDKTSACGSGDKPSSCGSGDKPSSCGSGDK